MLVTTERHRMIATFERLSEDAPTLCEGWDARDLLTHLIMREMYPHLLAGGKLPGLKRRKAAKEAELAAMPYEELIEHFRHGRSKANPLNMAKVDGYVNTVEYVVHHEDLRRAQNPVLGRVLTADEQAELAKVLPVFARMLLRKSTVDIELRPTGHQPLRVGPSPESVPEVIVSGSPLELVLFVFGRPSKVEITGEDAKVNKVVAMKKGI